MLKNVEDEFYCVTPMTKLYFYLLKLINESEVLRLPIYLIKSARLGTTSRLIKKKSKRRVPTNKL